MKTILVDDMLLDLQLFELKCADMPDFEIVGKFTDPNAAIEYAAGHVVDFALLDIDMPGMDGIHLAQALRRLRSDIIIVFATAHPKFAVEALKMKADYIIFKPFDREDIADVMERCPEELDFLNSFVDKGLIDRLTHVRDSDFARVSYTEAIEILKNSGEHFEYGAYWGMDMQTEHERYLAEKHFGRPVCVYNYPKEIKAFYMKQNDDGKTVAAVDVLVPGIGELIGGSQREDRLDVLEARMDELGLDRESYWWYLELRKYGSTPHAGFGLGFERLIMYLTGVSNIRDVLPFPRTTGSADF